MSRSNTAVNRPIGVYDSGIGGLTVLKALQQRLPDENYLYFADSGFVPYGEKSMQEIAERAMHVADLLVESHQVKALVVACNTATAAAIKQIRDEFSIPIIGMEPGIKPAVAATESGVIGVLATPATLNSTKYTNLKDSHGHVARVLEQPCPGLAARIEAGYTEDADTEAMLEGFLRPLLEQNADTIVLGCTHYPLVRPLIEQIVGKDVTIIETGAAVAREVERQLDQHALRRTEP